MEEIHRVAGLLEERGIFARWQFYHMKEHTIMDLCTDPNDTLAGSVDQRMFLFMSAVVENAKAYKDYPRSSGHRQQQQSQQEPAAGVEFQEAAVSAIQAIDRRARAGAARERGDRSPASSHTDDNKSRSVNVWSALHEYGLKGLPLDNLPKPSVLQSVLRGARRKASHNRLPWVSGELAKTFEPQRRSSDSTMLAVQKGQTFQSFAHFSSCWWSRALAQMSLQAECKKETVTFERLLRRWLDLCHMAQAHGVTVAYEYDAQQWGNIAGRVDARDPEVDVCKIFRKIDGDLRSDVRDQCSKAKHSGEAPGQQRGRRPDARNDEHEPPWRADRKR